MFGWLLNLAYLGLLAIVSPVLAYRAVVQGKYRRGWGQKLAGRLPRRDTDRPLVWVHAVSVGEVLLLRPILQGLQTARPGTRVLLTTTTATGFDVAREKYPDCRVAFFPLDFTWAVRRAVRRVRPDAVVLVELELWPNFIRAVHDAGVPLALINGRLSERSFRGYRRIRGLMSRTLRRFQMLAVQTEADRDRLRALGAPAERIHVTGSVKFDGVETDRDNPRTQALRTALGLTADASVFIAGSTQSPEEEFALRAYAELRPEFPDLRLVLVPRHKERFEAVAALIEHHGLSLLRRSDTLRATGPATPGCGDAAPVLLLDTLGELGACWGLADIAFVGGSLTSRGGQNMIEPAAYGAAVLFGPHTRNFRQVVELLLAHRAARVVHDSPALCAAVRDLLRHPAAARRLGRAARTVVLAQHGATPRTVRHLLALLPDEPRTLCDAA